MREKLLKGILYKNFGRKSIRLFFKTFNDLQFDHKISTFWATFGYYEQLQSFGIESAEFDVISADILANYSSKLLSRLKLPFPVVFFHIFPKVFIVLISGTSGRGLIQFWYIVKLP